LGSAKPSRLKGENNVAMGNTHRTEIMGTSSLKDLHKLHRVCGRCRGFVKDF